MGYQRKMTRMLDQDQFFLRRFHYLEVLHRNDGGRRHSALMETRDATSRAILQR